MRAAQDDADAALLLFQIYIERDVAVIFYANGAPAFADDGFGHLD